MEETLREVAWEVSTAETTATISVLVPAAGCGARAALNGNKVLAPLLEKPLLWHTLRALAAQIDFSSSDIASSITSSTRPSTRCAKIVEILVAARPSERAIVEKIYSETEIGLPLRVVEGGATRADSVRNCVDLARGVMVLVHDAARPCVTPEVTARVVAQALRSGAAIAALPADDTVKRVGGENIEETLERSTIYLAQTPQVFRREWLRDALHSAQQSGFCGTDCASYVERWLRLLRHSSASTRLQEQSHIKVVRGDAHNIKVTYADDLERAENWLQKKIKIA